MGKKIVFVNPNHEWFTQPGAYHSKSALKLRKITPPLGLGYLASVARNDNDIRIIEANALEMSMEETIKVVENENPEIVALTSFYTTRTAVLKMGETLRKMGLMTMVGGADPSAEPSDYASVYDIVVVGEGENTFRDILDGKRLEDIPGLCFEKNGTIVKTPPRNPIQNLDEIPFTPWDMLPIRKYKPETMCIKYKYPVAFMITGRGCPYRCYYCAANVVFPTVRARSIENVLDEIEYLCHEFNVKTIYFCDSTFTYNRDRVLKFCDLLIEERMDILWSIETRPDKVDRELLTKMRDAGCYYINYGVQTFNEKALAAINRPVPHQAVENAVSMSKELGILVRLEFILGLPDETEESMRGIVEKAAELDPDFVSFYPLLLLPKTKLADDKYYPAVSYDRLFEIASESYSTFYMRPKYIFSRLKTAYNPVYLKRYLDCLAVYLQ